MVGIVIVSHSFHLGLEVIKVASDLSFNGIPFPLINASGLEDSSLGTDPHRIARCIQEASRGKGVIIICDLGNSVQNSIRAIDLLKDHEKESIFIADAPLVEGVIVAVSANSNKTNIIKLLNEIEEIKTFSKIRKN